MKNICSTVVAQLQYKTHNQRWKRKLHICCILKEAVYRDVMMSSAYQKDLVVCRELSGELAEFGRDDSTFISVLDMRVDGVYEEELSKYA